MLEVNVALAADFYQARKRGRLPGGAAPCCSQLWMESTSAKPVGEHHVVEEWIACPDGGWDRRPVSENAMRALHRQHPMFRLVVREESTQDLEEGLRSGRLDMIISTPVDHPNSRQSLICQERFWIAVPQDDKLAEISGPVASQDLSGRTLLTVSPKHRLSHIVASLAEQVGGRISDDYEGTSLDAVRLMAAAGSGVAILPQIYASTEARRGPDLCLRLLSDSSIKRDLSLIQPFSREPRTGTDQLVEILKSEAAALIS